MPAIAPLPRIGRCLAYVPEAQLGDYVLVHVGFAIATVDEQAAEEALALLGEAGELEELGKARD